MPALGMADAEVSDYPLAISSGNWMLEYGGVRPIADSLVYYPGVTPKISLRIENASAADVSARCIVTILSATSDETPSRTAEGTTSNFPAHSSKNIDVELPDMVDNDVYDGSVQLLAADGKALSAPADIRWIVKTKDATFLKIVSAELDKPSYTAGETALATVEFQAIFDPSASDRSGNIEVTILNQQGDVVGENKITAPDLKDAGAEVSIAVTRDVEKPRLRAAVFWRGAVLDEYESRVDIVNPLDSSRSNETPPSSLIKPKPIIAAAILFLALAAALFFVLRLMRGKDAGKTNIIFFAAASVAAFAAAAALAATQYPYSGEGSLRRAVVDWATPPAGFVIKPGGTVRFSGRVYPNGGVTSVRNVRIRFFLSKDADVPKVGCGESACLNPSGGVQTWLLGQATNNLSYDQTFTVPSGVNWEGPVRAWIEYTATHRQDYYDCCFSEYDHHWAGGGWLIAYERGRVTLNDAQYVSQSVPAVMAAGQSAAVSVTMKNIGVTTWSQGGNYNLGSQNSPDNVTWGTGRVSVGGAPITANADKTFSFNVTAPSSPGTYNFQWRMVQDGVEWFGETTPNVAITVRQPVTIGGRVAKETGAPISGVAIDLCGAGTALTDGGGNWSKSIFAGDYYCARINAGLPAGWNFIQGTNNNGCHAGSATYEWQVAGQNQFVNCSYSDQRSWDLSSDNAMNFLVNYCNCTAWSNATCAIGGCAFNQRQQTRTCTPANCLAQSQCVNDATCCTCTAWNNAGCGTGGCGARQMQQTRSCSPANCQPQNQCLNDNACITLTASMTVSPTTGEVPLDVTTNVTVSGTAQGSINYTIWKDCDSACATVASCQAACGAWTAKADGQTTTTYSIGMNYSAPGTFHPRVIVEREIRSAAAGSAVTFTENHPPVLIQPMLATQPDYCESGPAVTCSWAYTDADGDGQSAYQVQIDDSADFSSPAVDTGTIVSSSKSYATPFGRLAYNTTYRWRVMVWDAKGKPSVWTSGPTFTTPPHQYPRVDFSWNPDKPVIDADITFTDQTTTSGSTIQSWSWTFESGDPAASTLEAPAVMFQNKGHFTVSLQITDSEGITCRAEKEIRVEKSLPEWEESSK